MSKRRVPEACAQLYNTDVLDCVFGGALGFCGVRREKQGGLPRHLWRENPVFGWGVWVVGFGSFFVFQIWQSKVVTRT